MNRKVVDGWYEAFRSKDMSKVRLAKDFVHTSPFGEIKGRDVYLDMVEANAGVFFSKKIDIIDVIDGGDKFAVRYRVNQMPVCEVIHVRNGEILRIDAYYHIGEKPVIPALSRWYSAQ